METLFDELVLLVLSWVDAPTLCVCTKVNRRLHRLANDDLLWKRLCDLRWKGRCLVGLKTLQLRKTDEIEYPSQLMLGEWKKKYRDAEIDSRRVTLTIDELCDLPWKFEAEWAPTHLTRFDRNFIFRGGGHPGPLPYAIYSSKNGPSLVRVAEYPSLKVRRRPSDWGWEMRNRHVTMTAVFDEEAAARLSSVSAFFEFEDL